jgi:hypothetical protein
MSTVVVHCPNQGDHRKYDERWKDEFDHRTKAVA